MPFQQLLAVRGLIYRSSCRRTPTLRMKTIQRMVVRVIIYGLLLFSETRTKLTYLPHPNNSPSASFQAAKKQGQFVQTHDMYLVYGLRF